MLDLKSLCIDVQKITREVGSFLSAECASFKIDQAKEKGLHDYVSYVDKESERRIVKALSDLFPSAGFLTEEGSVDYHNEPYFWVVDPLDGTSNYIRNMAPFSISIALCSSQEVLLGVVYEVCRDECFYAYKGSPAYLNGKEIKVSEINEMNNAFIEMGLPYKSEEYHSMAVYLLDQFYGKVGATRIFGSAAVELCYIAAGRFEGRIEAYLGSWDIAAGCFILNQAGGKVTNFKGEDVWLSGKEVIATNGLIHEAICNIINSKK